jgi:hypothetical protein
LLDALVDAVEAQDEAVGAVTSEDARTRAEQIASRALDAIGHPRETSAALVYDENGAVAYQQPSD